MPASIVARQTRTTQLTKCSFLPCQADAVREAGAGLFLCQAHDDALLFIRWLFGVGLLGEEVAMVLAPATTPQGP